MRAVVQRVKEARVTINGNISGKIESGLLVLLAAHKEDKLEETNWLVNKILNLRIFADEDGKMNRSVKDVGGQVLVVSQFTLYGNCAKGRRPDFLESAKPELAIPIYEKFLNEIREEMGDVQSGEFGANMQVTSTNDGPITIIIDTPQ